MIEVPMHEVTFTSPVWAVIRSCTGDAQAAVRSAKQAAESGARRWGVTVTWTEAEFVRYSPMGRHVRLYGNAVWRGAGIGDTVEERVCDARYSEWFPDPDHPGLSPLRVVEWTPEIAPGLA